MITFLIVAVWVLLTWKLGKWDQIQQFSPTILFYIVFNLLYNILFFDQLLWKYESNSAYLGHTSISLIFTYVTVPCTIIIFLSYLPKKKPYLYLLFWITLYSIIELTMNKLKLFTYHNGWSLKWSVFFNVVMFLSISIHFRKPLLGVLFAVLIATALLFVFPPSFEKML